MMTAKDLVLKICRQNSDSWCMRKGEGAEKCMILDINRTEPVPNGYPGQQRSKRVFTGLTWSSVLDSMRYEGCTDI